MRLIAAVALIFLLFGVSYAQEASVSTDKFVYHSGEKIKITFKNISSQSLFSIGASSTPDFAISNVERKLSQWSWDAFRLHCGWPDCDIDFDAPGEIKPGKSVSFQWQPKIYLNKKYVVPQPGLWRMTFIYQIRKDGDAKHWIWKTIKSNEFTLE
ncbi:MAG: hypothetical protein NTY14_04680 [Candidatus Omnitrophica bacterium]|nr:hypothetical protein [Candidatus Omnitrophota bacterium]